MAFLPHGEVRRGPLFPVFLIGALAQKENLRLLQHQNTMPTDRLTPHILSLVVQ